MIMKISSCMQNKIKKDLIILNAHETLYDHDFYQADLYFHKKEDDLLIEVIKWLNEIDTYFKTSYNTYKIDCGRFKGIFPRKVFYYLKIASFYVYSFEKESWKDWFIMEGENYASIKSP